MACEPKISVALVTRNGPERLERCLRSLREQSVQPFEVIVSDDSEEKCMAATRVVAERYGCHYIVGPRRGLYANRNHVAVACRGTHIRTMDDDHTFPPGHFKLCLQAVFSDPESIWTTGEIGYMDGRYFGTVDTAFQLGPAGVGYPVIDPDNNWAVADGSTIYPAEIFQRGLRMEESFGYGSSYLEFGAFLYAHNYKSRCVPGAKITHHSGIETISRKPSSLSAGSHLFAAICFNCYFKRDTKRIVRYVLPPTLRLLCRDFGMIHRVWSLAKARWTFAEVSTIPFTNT